MALETLEDRTLLAAPVETISVDQSESPFVRVNGALDIGAVESQSSVVLNGTAGNDVVTISLGSVYTVTINGALYTIGIPGSVSQITVHGLGGNDTLHAIGTAGVDNVTLHPGSLQLVGSGITVNADSFEIIDVATGGGQDTGFLWDSVGSDTYTASPTQATLAGPGFSNTVVGFRRAYAYSYAGGFDTASLSDSAGVDNFVGEEARSWLTGTSYYNSASRFDRVEAFSTSPYDLAMFWDSAGDDTFTLEPGEASLSGAGFNNIAHNFWRAYAYSYVGGTDEAHMYDSAANDRFIARDIRSTIQDATLSYYGSATRFEEVYSYAQNGGNDRADLYGNANNDMLVSVHGTTTMSASNYFYEVQGYEAVNGNAGAGGTDTATASDSAGNDYFLNIPSSSYVVRGDGSRVSLFNFLSVDFNSTWGGTDTAEFRSLQTVDAVFGFDAWVRVDRNNGKTTQANGIANVIAESLAAPGPWLNLTSLDYQFTQPGTWSNDALITMSSGYAKPFTPLTLSGEVIDPALPTIVTFTDPHGNQFSVSPTSVDSLGVRFPVPIYMDLTTGQVSNGVYSVQLQQQTSSGMVSYGAHKKLHVDTLPPTGVPPGYVLNTFLTQMQTFYGNLVTDWQKIADQASPFVDLSSLVSMIQWSQYNLSDLQSQLSPLIEGEVSGVELTSTIAMTQETLIDIDRVLLAQLSKISSVSQLSSASSFKGVAGVPFAAIQYPQLSSSQIVDDIVQNTFAVITNIDGDYARMLPSLLTIKEGGVAGAAIGAALGAASTGAVLAAPAAGAAAAKVVDTAGNTALILTGVSLRVAADMIRNGGTLTQEDIQALSLYTLGLAGQEI